MNIRFCPSCGTKKVENAVFCGQCGAQFEKAAEANASFLPALLIVVLLLSGAFYGVAHFMVNNKSVAPVPAVAANAGHDHDHDDHDHDHEHNHGPELAALEKKAQSGNVEDQMAVVDYYIHQGNGSADYLAHAAAMLDKILVSYPNHGFSLRLLGNIYYNLREHELAINAYQRYLALHPNDLMVMVDLATQYLANNELDKAINGYLKAIEGEPNFYNAWFNLSVAYKQNKQPGKAQEAENKALEIEKKHGKYSPSILDLPRLPTATEKASVSMVSEGLDYSSLNKFFREHMIISNKMTSFKAKDGIGILHVQDFPMDKMPENMRMSFEAKIKAQLAQVGDDARLQIRDVNGDKLLANY